MGSIGASEQRAAGFNSMPASHWLGSAGSQLSREPVAEQSEGQVGTIRECAAHSLGQPGCRCSQPLSLLDPVFCQFPLPPPPHPRLFARPAPSCLLVSLLLGPRLCWSLPFPWSALTLAKPRAFLQPWQEEHVAHWAAEI